MIFAASFAYIWMSAFLDPNYLQDMPEEAEARTAILKQDVWRGILACVVFTSAFASLKPYPDYQLGPWQYRFNRVCVSLMQVYLCF